MTWGLWDDLTIIDSRWLGLSNDATATAFRANTWARGPGAKERPGFVTLRQLRALSGGISARAFHAAIAELVNAGKHFHTVGILEPSGDGFLVHGPRNAAAQPVATATPVEPLSSLAPKLSRSEAGKIGGSKSAESRRNTFGSAKPGTKQTPKLPEANVRSTHEANSEANSEANTEAPRSKPETTDQVASKLPIPIPNQAAAASVNLIRSTPEANVPKQEAAAAVASDIQERAEAFLTDTFRPGDHNPPHRWPELLSVVRAWHLLAGFDRPKLGDYASDPDVRALVGLLAAGWSPDELTELAPLVATWLAAGTPDGRPRTVAMVTPAVLRIAQQQREQEAKVAREAAELVSATAAGAP